MKLILSRKCRSEKGKSDGGGGNKIDATLVACKARGKFDRNTDLRMVAHGGSNEDVSGSVL